MKRIGVLGYEFRFKSAANIGDYVQSLAALNLTGEELNQVQIINREQLADWSGDLTAVIMNGWYMHRPEQWPPSDLIDPLYVSMHVNPTVYHRFSMIDSVSHLKKHEPVGCRDIQTQAFMKKLGVEAYYSACLTLTLDRSDYCSTETRAGVLFCDIAHGKGSFSSLFQRADLSLPQKLVRIPRVLWERLFFVNSAQVIGKLRAALPGENVTKLTTQIDAKLSEKCRFDLARQYLGMYGSAKLVITSRIHVALPCLAFGTPVLFVNPRIDNARFPGLIELFNSMSVAEILLVSDEALARKLKSLKNSDSYLTYREALRKKVAEFLGRTD